MGGASVWVPIFEVEAMLGGSVWTLVSALTTAGGASDWTPVSLNEGGGCTVVPSCRSTARGLARANPHASSSLLCSLRSMGCVEGGGCLPAGALAVRAPRSCSLASPRALPRLVSPPSYLFALVLNGVGGDVL
jgi:hypothetical protein